MICKKVYTIPRRWPFEPIDPPGNAWDDFLGNPAVTIFITYYTYIFLHGFYPPIVSVASGLVISFLYQSITSKIIFFGLLTTVTGIYGLYFWSRLRRLRSPRLYLRYIAPELAQFVCVQVFLLYLISIAIFPFGMCYLIMMSFTRNMHISALKNMNADGEI